MVGRISAQVDHRFNEVHDNAWGMFGFLELEEDPDVLDALLAAAEAWLRARGRDRMVGPMDFTMNDESGVLVEGFDREPMVRQPWHPPYYRRLCERAGLAKAMDLLMCELVIGDRAKILPIIFELAEKVRSEHGIRIRRMSRRSLRRDMDVFAEIYNEAWKRNWDFVPYTEEDLDAYTQEMQLVFDPRLVHGRRARGHGRGRWPSRSRSPTSTRCCAGCAAGCCRSAGWHFLRRRRTIDRCRVGFLGVKPEYQHTGAAAALYVEHFDTAGRERDQVGRDGLDPRDQPGR